MACSPAVDILEHKVTEDAEDRALPEREQRVSTQLARHNATVGTASISRAPTATESIQCAPVQLAQSIHLTSSTLAPRRTRTIIHTETCSRLVHA